MAAAEEESRKFMSSSLFFYYFPLTLISVKNPDETLKETLRDEDDVDSFDAVIPVQDEQVKHD